MISNSYHQKIPATQNSILDDRHTKTHTNTHYTSIQSIIPIHHLLLIYTSPTQASKFLHPHSVRVKLRLATPKMAATPAESVIKMSANASSLCNLNGSSRRPLPVASQSTRRRSKANSSVRVQGLSSSFFGSFRLPCSASKMSTLQQRRNFSVLAMAAGNFFLSLV